MKKEYFIFSIIFCAHIFFAQINNNKKILIVATSANNLISKPDDHTWGCWAPEISDFYATLYNSGFRIKDVDIVSPMGGNVPLAYKMHYPKKIKIPDEEKKAFEDKVKNSLNPSQINPNDYNVIYYSGGYSCLVDYPNSKSIGDIAAKIYENGGIVSALSQGIAGLIPVKLSNDKFLVENKTIATNAFKNKTDSVSKQLIREGAIIGDSKIIADGNLVTAHGAMPITLAKKVLSLIGLTMQKQK